MKLEQKWFISTLYFTYISININILIIYNFFNLKNYFNIIYFDYILLKKIIYLFKFFSYKY